jgi:hypothetical protein
MDNSSFPASRDPWGPMPDSSLSPSDQTMPDALTPTVDERPAAYDLTSSGVNSEAVKLGPQSTQRFDIAILTIGTLVLLWKMHAFKLPSQIAAEQLQQLNALRSKNAQPLLPTKKVHLWNSISDWVQPWRWGRGDLLKNTTPTGGDYGAHVWLPDYVKRALLPKGRLTGWSNDWFAGFPALGFYFPLPLLTIVFLSFLLPYGIAFKIVSVLGICTLPFASYRCGRLAGLADPTPLFLALGAFVFLLGRQYDLFIYGGAILPTMAGEFSFSIGLSFAVLFLGSFVRVLRTGNGKRVAALHLTCSGLSHILPTMWVLCVAVCLVVGFSVARRSWRAVTRRASFVFVVAAMMASWWLLPFAMNLAYTNDMGWEKSVRYKEFLFPFFAKNPPGDSQLIAIAFVLALFGVGRLLFAAQASRRKKRDSIVLDEPVTSVSITDANIFIGALIVAFIGCGLLFRFAPQHRLWNARILPFWFLSVLFLGAFGAASIPRVNRRLVKFIGVVSVTVALGIPLGLLPGWLPVLRASDAMVGLQLARRSNDSHAMISWTGHNFRGYEMQADWPEYKALMEEAKKVGVTHGCGRAAWEHEEVRMGRYGTTLSLMLLPYWTRGCIGSMDGLYFESSASLPHHWFLASLTSAATKNDANGTQLYSGFTNPQRNLSYPGFDLVRAVSEMRKAGVRYYIAVTDETKAAASNLASDLQPVGSSGPYVVYRVRESELVRSLQLEPVVVTGIGAGQDEGWLDVWTAAFATPDLFPQTMVASGPKTWGRTRASIKKPPGIRTFGASTTIGTFVEKRQPTVAISNISQSSVEISFDVDRIGIPVAVNTSFFPNWKAKGAQGPYRSMPNYMVVVPTEKRVRLQYGYSGADRLGWLCTFAGIGVMALPALAKVRRRIRRPGNEPGHLSI